MVGCSNAEVPNPSLPGWKEKIKNNQRDLAHIQILSPPDLKFANDTAAENKWIKENDSRMYSFVYPKEFLDEKTKYGRYWMIDSSRVIKICAYVNESEKPEEYLKNNQLEIFKHFEADCIEEFKTFNMVGYKYCYPKNHVVGRIFWNEFYTYYIELHGIKSKHEELDEIITKLKYEN